MGEGSEGTAVSSTSAACPLSSGRRLTNSTHA